MWLTDSLCLHFAKVISRKSPKRSQNKLGHLKVDFSSLARSGAALWTVMLHRTPARNMLASRSSAYSLATRSAGRRTCR